jgi:hypothetical protein
VAVVACLLAIWEFTGTDILWRTVATCAVIGGGTNQGKAATEPCT